MKNLDVTNIPQEASFTTCEAVDKVHSHDGDEAKNTNDTENNRDEDKTEHFTVLLSGL